ncbi:hypothetical protein C8A05DRAFT_35595 [Staphylotrichum tortipilum]|uniref:Uncharacterized protein n=1 Tax=Staphylotrichum tortipilum TaxID=2831512 RepID=A0AAN6MH36_9PEZI|nr:hypothetical protein C8A05DRAFT_35595 [Staphylotrichum longicolle]
MATTAAPDKQHGGRYHVDNGAPRLSTPDALPPLERLSINRLLALYPRERLLVHPLRWTGRQLDLLACRIHSRRADAPSDDHSADHDEARSVSCSSGPGPGSLPRRLARLLATRLEGGMSMDAAEFADTVALLLAPISPRPIWIHSKSLGLHLEQRSVASIPVLYASVSMRPPASGSITLAYLDSIDICRARSDHLTPPLNGDRTNWAGFHRAIALGKMYKPVDPEQDPFLVALVIALAQRDRRRAAQPLPPDSSFAVRILCTGEGHPKPINIYVAHVRSSFLNKLDFPDLEPAAGSGLDITHWRVPTEPFQTLPHRVCRALGLLDRSHGEILAQYVGRPMAGSKRKRDHSDGCMPNPSSTCQPRKGAASPAVPPAAGDALAGADR